ncbi:Ig group 2 domain-containingprotein [Purpureocillium lavendulum]|uniref:Ig group 2 domain-containingprotein n=1 Tax=Purpureocillium lavendulum TaxID=1247861 RepID=A0AB34FUY8_9HYPO|nr:Ig group 2 domain-containingprotein [Purpureocillium lavendulum]
MPEAKVRARPARANSFHRMLELEKQYMVSDDSPCPDSRSSRRGPPRIDESSSQLERLQTSKPLDPQPPASHGSPVRSSIQARRAEVRPPATSEPPPPPRRGPRPPLVINTAAPPKKTVPITAPAPREPAAAAVAVAVTVVDDVPAANAGIASAVDKPSPKVVAFAFPPQEMMTKEKAKEMMTKDADRQSICVSPSWESQSRRREEKKMMEKKKREEKDREKKEEAKTARARRGRLSKLPPPGHRESKVLPPPKIQSQSQSQSQSHGVVVTREPLSMPPYKSAPTLPLLASPIPSLIPVSKPPDQDRGRKEQRNSFHAKDDHQPKKTRSRSSSFASLFRAPFERRRSSVDQTSEPEFIGGIKLELERHLDSERALMVQAGADEADIHPALRDKPALKSPPPDGKDPSRRHYPPITRHGKAQNARALVSPTAPAVPDVPKPDKWRFRMGLKSKADQGGPAAAQEKQQLQQESRTVVSPTTAHTTTVKPVVVDIPARRNPEDQDFSNNDSIPSVESHGYRTAPSSPEPPQRSPRRSQQSLASDSEARPPKTPVADVRAETLSTLSVTPKASELSRPPPPPLSSHPVHQAPVSNADHQMATATATKRPSSSEDSFSEEFHSPSPPSTPATSRPQSEKGLSFEKSRAPTQESQDATDDDIYEIQAAADRVLADFNKASPDRLSFDRLSFDRHSSSEATLAPKAQPARQKDKSSLPQANRMSVPARKVVAAAAAREHSQSPRPAAAYLQEARKLAPIAAQSRPSKQRLGPPASFILPGDAPSPSVRSEASRSCETVLTTTTRSLARHSTPSLLPGAEPVAKFFVECCGCKYYHDMPSNLYEAMADPGTVLAQRDTLGYAGSISVQVKCPWCKHEMSTKCCAGLAAMVYVTERLH